MNARLLFPLLGLLAVGCTPVGLTPVTNPTERLQLHGFSILPPEGENWYVNTNMKDPRRVIFNKLLAGASATHTFGVMAVARDVTEPVTSAVELRELLEKGLQEERREGGRFTLVRSKLEADASLGVECVRIEKVSDERENPHPRLRGTVLVLSIYGFDCLHPHAKLAIALLASERYEQGDRSQFDEALRREVDAFFRSVEFTRVP